MTATVATVESSAAALVASAQRLTSTQRSGLRRVVVNDFKAQKVQVKREAEAAVQRWHAEQAAARNEEYAARQRFQAEVDALVASIKPEIHKVIEQAKVEGYHCYDRDRSISLYFSTTPQSAKSDDEQRAVAKIKSAERQALLALEAAQNEVERGLLLASLTEEAQAALDNVPKAADLFAAAYNA